jgi:hypothetical protein
MARRPLPTTDPALRSWPAPWLRHTVGIRTFRSFTAPLATTIRKFPQMMSGLIHELYRSAPKRATSRRKMRKSLNYQLLPQPRYFHC